MQIIQLADLHITNSSNIEIIKHKIDLLFESLSLELNPNEQIICCILGDLIDKGDPNLYSEADKIVRHIEMHLKKYNATIEFTAGNHDLCNCPYPHPVPHICPETKCTLDDYNKFVSQYGVSNSGDLSVLLREYDDLNILIVNSVFHRNCKFGLLNIDVLKKVELIKPTIIITHHTFFNENDYDASAIRNAYKLFDFIENKGIIGILHGHTHGFKDISVGSCRIVGVGPFLKPIHDINNQANLLNISISGIHSIKNYIYRADMDKYLCGTVFADHSNAIYFDKSIATCYERIVNDTKRVGVIPNLIMNAKNSIDAFNQEMERIFPTQIDTAKAWQANVVPPNLYYNHGEYMQYDGLRGMDFVINELKNKATSSRAIIPLINFEAVAKSGDKFLPSFDLVQFGFNEEEKTTLIIDLYLRALEVKHFLKINLSEIYLMANEISSEIRSIVAVDITLITFRAQYKEEFGCFTKAQIDTMTEAQITMCMISDAKHIVQMLHEKLKFSETVIEDKGILSLSNALNAINGDSKIRDTISVKMQSVICEMNHLKLEREKTSNYQVIQQCEKTLETAVNELIVEFEGGIFR